MLNLILPIHLFIAFTKLIYYLSILMSESSCTTTCTTPLLLCLSPLYLSLPAASFSSFLIKTPHLNQLVIQWKEKTILHSTIFAHSVSAVPFFPFNFLWIYTKVMRYCLKKESSIIMLTGLTWKRQKIWRKRIKPL